MTKHSQPQKGNAKLLTTAASDQAAAASALLDIILTVCGSSAAFFDHGSCAKRQPPAASKSCRRRLSNSLHRRCALHRAPATSLAEIGTAVQYGGHHTVGNSKSTTQKE